MFFHIRIAIYRHNKLTWKSLSSQTEARDRLCEKFGLTKWPIPLKWKVGDEPMEFLSFLGGTKNPIPSMGRTVYLTYNFFWWIFCGGMKPGNLLDAATGQPFRKIDISHLWQGKNSPCQPSWDMLVPKRVFFNGSRYLIQYHWVSGIMAKSRLPKIQKAYTWKSLENVSETIGFHNFHLKGLKVMWVSGTLNKSPRATAEVNQKYQVDASWTQEILYTHSLSKLKVTTFFGEIYGISFTLFWRMCFFHQEVVGFSPWPMAPNPRDTALLWPFEGVVERIAFLGQWHGEKETAGEM